MGDEPDEMNTVEPFSAIDAQAVHHAMVTARHEASERRERMPSSADALERQADELLIVRNKILGRLSAEVRLAYPDYANPDVARSAGVT